MKENEPIFFSGELDGATAAMQYVATEAAVDYDQSPEVSTQHIDLPPGVGVVMALGTVTLIIGAGIVKERYFPKK